MTIAGEGKSLSFDISDVGPGVTAIDECVARHLAEPHLPRNPQRRRRSYAVDDAAAGSIAATVYSKAVGG